jgi:endonuclease G
MLAFLLAAAVAATSPCPAHFAGGVEPDVAAVVEVCFTGFAVGYSANWREPSWSAEHITAESAAEGEAAKRNGAFHECALPDGASGVSPKDYAKSGYDLGHATPAGDRGADKPETFGTCNMMPQRPNLNRKVWTGIEASVRNLATSGADLYVVTGPLVPADAPTIGPDHVAVPSATWKAVYEVGRGAEAWMCSNIDVPVCAQEPLAALDVAIGFDPFPGVADADLASIQLPAPTKGAN